jgi:hypothetical protein
MKTQTFNLDLYSIEFTTVRGEFEYKKVKPDNTVYAIYYCYHQIMQKKKIV